MGRVFRFGVTAAGRAKSMSLAIRRIRAVIDTGATALDLGDLALDELPDELGRAKTLRDLSLGEGFNFVGAEKITWETEHRAKFGRFNRIDCLSELKDLKILELSGCGNVSDLKPLSGLVNLTKLNLTACKSISDLAPLAGLNSLAELYLTACVSVSNLTPLTGLKTVTGLYLSGCTVTDLTPLASLNMLNTLDLSACKKISELKSLSKLINLKLLYLNGCELIADLTPIVTLPDLASLYIRGTNVSPPDELRGSTDARAILAWWRAEQAATHRRRLLEVKLLIVGQGQVGKSHLRDRLFGGDGMGFYDADIESTESFDCVQKEVSVPDPENATREATVVVRAWDFAGQTELHSSHRFFLGAQRCFYLLVLAADRPPNGDGPDSNRLNYWLRLIAHHGTRPATQEKPEQRAPVLIVVSRCDEPAADLAAIRLAIDDARRADFFGANVLPVVEGAGLPVAEGFGWSPEAGPAVWERHTAAGEAIRAAIHRHLAAVPDLWQKEIEEYHTGLRFVRDTFANGIKDRPMSRAYLTRDTLAEFTKLFHGKAGTANDDQLLAFRNLCLGMLQHLGAVHWVAELVPTGPTTPWPVKDTAFNPEWVKWPVYDLLRQDKHKCPRPGFLPDSLIKYKLFNHSATQHGKDLYRQLPFADDDHDRVRALMTECRLAYDSDTDDGNGLLIPDLLDAAELADDPPATAWAYRVPFLPERVFLRYLAEIYLTQREPTDTYHRNRVVRTLAGRRVAVEARYSPPGRERPYLAIFPETGEPLHELAVWHFRDAIERLFKSEKFTLDGHFFEPVGERPVAGSDPFVFLCHPLEPAGKRTRPRYDFTIRFRGVDLADPQGKERTRQPWTNQAGLLRLRLLVVNAGTDVWVEHLYRTENPVAERFATPTPDRPEATPHPAPARTTPDGKKLSRLKQRLVEERRRLVELGQRLKHLFGVSDPELVAETDQCRAMIEKLEDQIRRAENKERKSAMTAVQSSLQAAEAEVRGRLIACGFLNEVDHFEHCLSSDGRPYRFGYANTVIPWRTK